MMTVTSDMTSQKVIRSYLVIAGLYTLSASLIWGVNTLFLLDAGLDIAGVFIANAVFTAGMVVFEIPTGVLADTTGRRASFLLSVIVLFFSTLAYVAVGEMGGGLFEFCVISVFLGLGFTFYSGAVEAWLVDALKATDYTQELDHVFARGSQVTGGAMLIGSVSGGVIGTFDLSLPYVVRAILLAIVFVIAFYSMHDLGYEKRALHLSAIPQEMRKLTRDSVTYGWREPHIRILMMVSFVQSGFMIFAFYAWQPYFLELLGDPDAIWVAGVISALMSISMIAGNAFTDWGTHREGKRTTLMIASVSIFSVCMLGVGLTTSFWVAAPLFLLAMGTTGVAGPVRQSYIHHIIPSEQRASVLSVDSMFSSGGGILFQTGLGQIAQNRGIGEGYIIGSVATFVCAPLLLLLRRMGHSADIIKGDAAHKGGFAAQGRPDVTGVDAKPQATQEVKAVSAD